MVKTVNIAFALPFDSVKVVAGVESLMRFAITRNLWLDDQVGDHAVALVKGALVRLGISEEAAEGLTEHVGEEIERGGEARVAALAQQLARAAGDLLTGI